MVLIYTATKTVNNWRLDREYEQPKCGGEGITNRLCHLTSTGYLNFVSGNL